MSNGAAGAAQSTASPGKHPIPATGHLRQVDLVRVVTFAGVIGVHAVGQTVSPTSYAGNGVGLMLHFTREVFMFLTAFVLFHTYYRKDFSITTFWRRRFVAVGVPYVVWSLIYQADYMIDTFHDPWTMLHELGYLLLTGNACYHLYFIVVSLQIYALFPLLVWLVRKTEGKHALLLAVTAVVNLCILAWVHDRPHVSGLQLVLFIHAPALFPTYIFYILGGAIAAVHLPRLHDLIRRHARAVPTVFIIGGVVTWAVYQWQIDHGVDMLRATEALQPLMLFWSTIVGVSLYALGMRWVYDGPSRRGLAFFREASLISFGVFLVHPLMLHLAAYLNLQWPNPVIPAPWTSFAAWFFAISTSAIIIELAMRTPLSFVLTGRHRPTRLHAVN